MQNTTAETWKEELGENYYLYVAKGGKGEDGRDGKRTQGHANRFFYEKEPPSSSKLYRPAEIWSVLSVTGADRGMEALRHPIDSKNNLYINKTVRTACALV